MTSNQQRIIHELGVQPIISPKEEIRLRIHFLKRYLQESNAKGFVLGVSGGQDSTLAGRLAQLAVEALRAEGHDAQFVALRLPYGVQQDEEDAKLALSFIAPDVVHTFNIQPTVDTFQTSFNGMTQLTLSDFHKGNVKARVRMMMHYAIAGEQQLLVIGTDHAAEAITGFSTKYGDGAADIMPLFGLTKQQGKQLLQTLNAPVRLHEKIPTADLLDDSPLQADEVELGVSYTDINRYLTGEAVNPFVATILETRYTQSTHKRNGPVCYRPNERGNPE